MRRYLLLALFLLGACAPKTETRVQMSQKTEAEIEDLRFDGQAEASKDRIDVYESMARAVKYNVGAIAQEMNAKIFSNNDPKSTLKGIENIKSETDTPLFVGLKALDYAVIYSSSILSNDSQFIGETLYKKSAENLSLAGIKSHKAGLYALKENKSFKNLMRAEAKTLKRLNEEYQKKGKLSQEDLEYKKGLEVFLLNMSNMQTAFLQDMITHAKIIHERDPEKMKLEGRKFYELEDFDKKYSIEIFQRSALKNRREFLIGGSLDENAFGHIEANVLRRYPEVERLNISGYDFKAKMYIEALENKALKIANDLIDVSIKYQNTNLQREKAEVGKEVLETMAAAMFAQVELAYNLIYQSGYEAQGVNEELAKIKKEKNELGRRFKLDAAQKNEALNLKVKEIELEYKLSQIIAERAMAVRAIYFYAGLDPFSKDIIKSDIKAITIRLRYSFNKDMVELLAKVPQVEIKAQSINNSWAKEDNWLEKVLEENAGNKAGNKPLKSVGEYDLYEDSEYNKFTTMQLGYYQKKESADIEWSYLKDLYPELKKYSPVVEEAEKNGQKGYYMMLKSNEGGWIELCNKLRQGRVYCMLK